MSKKVSIQNIADELGLSRNTVSRALNGSKMSEKTRRVIINKAIELGYKSFDLVWPVSKPSSHKNILLLSPRPLIFINFFIHVIRGLEANALNNNVELFQYIHRPHSPFNYITDYIKQFNIDGIICIEAFDKKFVSEVLSINKPVVFFDFMPSYSDINGTFDILLTENLDVVKSACLEIIAEGTKTFGFVGESMHCLGFYERFLGMREALFLNDIPYDPGYSILNDSTFPYNNSDAMWSAFKSLKDLPDCFVCANDYIAACVFATLKKYKVAIPSRVKLLGFENSPEYKYLSPQLSTINVDKMLIGRKLLTTILERIDEPSQKNRIIYIKSNYIKKGST